MKQLKLIFSAIVVFLLAGCAATVSQPATSTTGANASTAAKGTLLQTVKDKKKLVLGTSADFAPFEWHQVKDGKDTIVGFDIEIAQTIAQKLGVELEIQDMNFDSLVAAVKTGKVDMVMAGMNPTPDRAKEVLFSDIYYESGFSVLTTKENVEKFKAFEALDGATVGVQKGTVPEEIVPEKLPKAKMTSMPKNDALVLALKTKRLDAIVVDLIVAKNFVKLNDDLAITEAKVPQEVSGSAVAVQKGNEEFMAIVNEVIKEMKDSGKLEELMVKYTDQMND